MPGTFLYDLAVNNPTSNKKSQLCLAEHVHKIEFSERASFSLCSIPRTGGTHREYTHRYTNMNMTSPLTKDFSHLSVADKKAPTKAAFPDSWHKFLPGAMSWSMTIIRNMTSWSWRQSAHTGSSAESLICLHFIISPIETKAYSTWSGRPIRK